MTDMTLRMLLLGEDKSQSSTLRKVAAEADQTSNHLSGMGAKAVAIGSAVGTFAASGVMALGRMGLSAVKAGVQTAASMEQADIAFTQLLGSQRKSADFMTRLKSFAAATPFELPGLIDASRQLIGVGENANNVIPTLTAFGDASGALGLSQDNFNHIMMATTQAMSAGKFQAGDMLQITQAGLPVWNILSQALGKPVAKLKDLASQGKLLSKDVMPALQAQMEKNYGGAMAKQSQTLTGLWSTMMDTFHQGLASAIVPMEPMLRSAIPKAADVMGKALGALGGGAQQFFGGLSGHVKRMKQQDRPAVELFGMGLRAMFGALRGGGVTSTGFIGQMERIGVTLRQLGLAVLNMGRAVLPLLIEAWQAFRQPLTSLFRFLVDTGIPAIISMSKWMQEHGTIVRSVAVAVGTIIAAIKIWQIVTKTMAAAQVALNVVMSLNPIGIVVLAILGLAAGLIYAYKHSATFRAIVTGAFGAVKAIAVGVFNWFHSNWPLLLAILTGPIGIAVLVISRHWGHIRQGATDVRNWITARFSDLIGFFTGMPGRIGRVASGMFNGIKDAFRSAINFVIDGWNSLHFSLSIPKLHIKGTNQDIGGGSFGFGVPRIQRLAQGGVIAAAGRVLVGDAGPEYLDLPVGARVTPLGRGGGDTIINLTVPILYGDAKTAARQIATELERLSHNGRPLNLRLANA